MMDHNEATQAIDGVETAELMEIVDHHRLGTIKTSSPVTFYAKPVGSNVHLFISFIKHIKLIFQKNMLCFYLAVCLVIQLL